MSTLNGFLDNLLTGTLNPKGNLGDFRHSAYLYNTNSFRLAPKSKFLYHVVFELTPDAQRSVPQINRYREEINMLVKSAELPKFQAQTETRNQYNRKKNFQTSIQYQPVNITFHDDNFGITTLLLEAYYRYYFKDGNYADSISSTAYDARSTYKSSVLASNKYGYDNGSRQPFFRRITIYQLSRQSYTGFTLVNPLITDWGHDSLDNSDSNPTANNITVAYEAAHYTRGKIEDGIPAGFGNSHYDQTPSPITIQGGGTSTVLGPGGLFDGVGSILNDISTGNIGLDTILKGVNTVRNAKNLSNEGLREEGVSLIRGVATAAVPSLLGTISNTVFPKSTGNGGTPSETTATGGVSNPDDPRYQAILAAAAAAQTGE